MHLRALALLAPALALAVPARAAPVALTAPGANTVLSQVVEIAGGRVCMAGVTVGSPREPERGTLIVFDLAANRVAWQKTIDPPAGSGRLAFRACQAGGGGVHAGAEAVAAAGKDGRLSAPWVYRFDDQGRLLASKEVETGSSEARVYAIEADADGVTLAGATGDASAAVTSNGMFVARLDSLLHGATVTRLPTGAFAHGAVARLAGNALYVGGNFLPAAQPGGAKPDDYAMSRIVGGKYRFSARPVKRRSNGVVTAIAPASDIVALGNDGRTTQLVAVGADGKPREDLQVASAFCWTSAISADATTVYAIRTECRDPDTPAVLTAIDRRSGAEVVVSGIVGEPEYVLATGAKLVVIAKKRDGTLMLQALAKGADREE
ncbi:hypothetical protein [uncultured Massilia sp.]|uniref:hypothetical protein n=1 Tax=uncultured Massilia sp. TaxID=169973 RepID=UPI0025F27F13|nr:hypothetical protein [uncultured Massilia sp.]